MVPSVFFVGSFATLCNAIPYFRYIENSRPYFQPTHRVLSGYFNSFQKSTRLPLKVCNKHSKYKWQNVTLHITPTRCINLPLYWGIYNFFLLFINFTFICVRNCKYQTTTATNKKTKSNYLLLNKILLFVSFVTKYCNFPFVKLSFFSFFLFLPIFCLLLCS